MRSIWLTLGGISKEIIQSFSYKQNHHFHLLQNYYTLLLIVERKLLVASVTCVAVGGFGMDLSEAMRRIFLRY